jgi:hypothetical protein
MKNAIRFGVAASAAKLGSGGLLLWIALWVLSTAASSCGEAENLAGDTDSDEDVREHACPPPPECTGDLVRGEYGLVDDYGCVSYCCVGIEMVFEEVRVESGMDLTVHARVSGTVLGDAHDSSAMVSVSSEIIHPASGSVFGTCGEFEIPYGEAFHDPYDLEMDCTLSGPPPPCDEQVEAVFSCKWTTLQCHAEHETSESVSTTLLCVY